MGKELKDTYFRRAFIPIIIALLICATIFAVIVASPGKDLDWGSKFADGMTGGALYKALRKAF